MKRQIVRILLVLVVVTSVALPIISWWLTVWFTLNGFVIGSGQGDVFAFSRYPGVILPPDGVSWESAFHQGYGPWWEFYFHKLVFNVSPRSLPWWLINVVLWPVAGGGWWWTGRWRRSGKKRGFPVEANREGAAD